MKYIVFVAALCASSVTVAQTYPSKAIRWVAPSASGSTSDIVARMVAERLRAALGVPVNVDNRPGAGGNITAEITVKSPPDGYTVMTGISALAINPTLYPKLSYDPLRDLAPIMLMSSAPLVLVVHPSVPVKTVKELIALAKRHPGELTFPSAGNGTASHLAGEYFKMIAGVNMVHVPYKIVTQGVLDLVAGRMTLMINVLPEMLPLIQAAKVNAIGLAAEKRSALLPQVPTIDEAGLRGFTATSWQGVLAPAKTPPEIIAKLNEELRKVLTTPEMRARFTELGLDIHASSPEEFARFLRAETEKYSKIIKASGAKVD